MDKLLLKEKEYYFVRTAEHYIGTPYIWGGDDFSGFDCSGITNEGLKSIGEIGSHEDFSAEGLWNKYKPLEIQRPRAGAMAFWFNNEGKAIHVAICISDYFCVTADGGGSKTLTLDDARKQNAFIKIRRVDHRKSQPKFVHIFDYLD